MPGRRGTWWAMIAGIQIDCEAGFDAGGLAKELGDGRDHGLLFVFAEFREDGQGEDFASGTFSFGEVYFNIAQKFERVLQVQWDGVKDLGADLARGEEVAKLITTCSSDDVLVPDVLAAWDFVRENDTVGGVEA